jgi:hypothetical protein
MLRSKLSSYRLDCVLALICSQAKIPWPDWIRADSQTWSIRTWIEIAVLAGEPVGDPPYHLWVSDDDDLLPLAIGECIGNRISEHVRIGDRSFSRLTKDHYEALRQRCRGRTDDAVVRLAEAIQKHGKPWERTAE